jgi:competence protein ComGC
VTDQVVRLAEAMLVFFIVCILLLVGKPQHRKAFITCLFKATKPGLSLLAI